MSTVLGLSTRVLQNFADNSDAQEFLRNNEIFWDREDELTYIQTHKVDLDHLEFVYRKYLASLSRLLELIELQVISANSSAAETRLG